MNCPTRLGGVQLLLNEFLSRLTEYRVDHRLYRWYALCTIELCLARPNLSVSPCHAGANQKLHHDRLIVLGRSNLRYRMIAFTKRAKRQESAGPSTTSLQALPCRMMARYVPKKQESGLSSTASGPQGRMMAVTMHSTPQESALPSTIYIRSSHTG